MRTGISLDVLVVRQYSGIAAATIQNWAREQLDKQDVDHRRFYLHCLHPPEPLPPAPSNEFLKEGNERRTEKPSVWPPLSTEGSTDGT